MHTNFETRPTNPLGQHPRKTLPAHEAPAGACLPVVFEGPPGRGFVSGVRNIRETIP